jgi:hypothetical protein
MTTRLKRNKKQQEEFLASLEEQEDGGQIPDIMQRMPEDNNWLEDDLDGDEEENAEKRVGDHSDAVSFPPS